MTLLDRRQALALVAALPSVGLAVAEQSATAATWPDRTVRIVSPLTPGGPNDVSARLIGQRLQEHSRIPFLIENRPGAATRIGNAAVARAAPDGTDLALRGGRTGRPSKLVLEPVVRLASPPDSDHARRDGAVVSRRRGAIAGTRPPRVHRPGSGAALRPDLRRARPGHRASPRHGAVHTQSAHGRSDDSLQRRSRRNSRDSIT